MLHWVDRICRDFGLSINELARKAGISPGTLGNAKRRNTPIRRLGYETVERLADALGVFKETLIVMYDDN